MLKASYNLTLGWVWCLQAGQNMELFRWRALLLASTYAESTGWGCCSTTSGKLLQVNSCCATGYVV